MLFRWEGKNFNRGVMILVARMDILVDVDISTLKITDIKVRPIISCSGSPIEKLSILATKIITPLLKFLPSHLKTYQILTENNINTTLDEIQKNIETNHEKISTDSKKKFLTYRKMDVNIFKYEALKKHVGTYIELSEKLQKNL